MISLLKLHWEFLRQPTICLEKYIKNWPVGIGFALYVFFLIGNELMNVEQLTLRLDVLVRYQDDFNAGSIYVWTILTSIITILLVWYVFPFLIRLLTKKSIQEFDANLYRKLVFYSPVAFSIFTIMFLLPLNLFFQIVAGVGVNNLKVIQLVGIMAILKGFISIWAGVLAVSSVVIICKGLSKFFGLNAWQIILVQFVAPAIIFVPIFLSKFPKFWEFVSNYTAVK